MNTPTIEDEMKLELEMAEEGRRTFLDRQRTAIVGGNGSMTSGGQTIVSGGIERVSEALTTYLQDQWLKFRAGGRKPVEFTILSKACPRVMSVLALRVLLDFLMFSESYTTVAVAIGKRAEREMMYEHLKKHSPGLFRWALKEVEHSPSEVHKHRVMRWTHGKSGAKWQPWSDELRCRVGAVLLKVIKSSVGIFAETKRTNVRGGRVRMKLILEPTPATIAWIKAHNHDASLLCPTLLPTIIAPRPWTNPTDGGYHAPSSIGTRTLVKRGRKNYLKELTNANPTKVYTAVNHLQETAWQINRRVFDVVARLWNGTHALGGLPSHDLLPVPQKPADIDTNEAARREYRREAAKVHDMNAETSQERNQAIRVMTTARRFLQYDRFYFPHELDFRGRVYAVTIALNPQGSKLSRGLLQFAEGKPLDTPEAYRWFCIHGANCYGVDKVSFDDRVDWITSNMERILRTGTGDHAMEDLWWSEADQPFAFLAFCYEMSAYQADKSTFVSRLPVMLDGSCSGLQHFAAMLRDEASAREVNLVPMDKPQDIYGRVAKHLTAKLGSLTGDTTLFRKTGLEVNWMARLWLGIGVDRDIVKRPVMTLPYGSTLFRHGDFIEEKLESKLKTSPRPEINSDNLSSVCHFLACHNWNAIGEIVTAAPRVMNWLRECAEIVVESGLSIAWVTPSGFPVLQGYRKLSSRQVKLTLGDEIRYVTLCKETPMFDTRRQVSGIAPNFVHSMDAAALVLAVNRVREQGVGSVCCIHDSFGTHAADTEKLAAAIKDTFVEMYTENDVLAQFHEALSANGLKLPPVPARGSLDISLVRQSLYCFA